MADNERDNPGQYADYREIQGLRAAAQRDRRAAIQRQGISGLIASGRKEIQDAQRRQLGGVSTPQDEHRTRVQSAKLDTRKP